MTIYKEYNHTIRITGENRNDEVINLEFQSYDKSVAKLVLDLYSENGLPINLTGATVHFLLVIDENQSIEILGKIEDLPAGKVSMEIPQQIKGYNGRVKCGVYIDFSDGSKIDVKNLVFDLEKSLIDNVDYTPIKGNLFQTFDLALTEIKNYMNNVKQDTVNYADNQKSAMLAKTNEVKSYGDTQKTQIGQVLPSVQSKVSAINTELAKINENMPDLFVAYADNLSGGGFSRTDSAKLFKGYGIKNSTNVADYRWERNVDSLQVGGTNLIKNTSNQLQHLERNDWHIMISQLNTKNFNLADYLGQRLTLRIWIEKPSVDAKLQFYFNHPNWRTGNVVKAGQSGYSQLTVDVPTTSPTVWNLAIGGGNGVAFILDYKELKAEIGDFATDWSPATEDVVLQSKPINSILTTLSAENPSTTLGGTWTQLGNESKFGSTIYYWKRTN